MDGIVNTFKKDMHTLMDGRDKGDMLNHIKQKNLPGLNGAPPLEDNLKPFVEKVKSLPFSSKEKYKILYCAIKENKLNGENIGLNNINSTAIQDWKKANGYKHLDCSHLHKGDETTETKVRREIIYILHNISLE
tara:strand:+ start:39 stop:440 length:402 start_codon:yes stop_codon:yes gene_type:complete